jgi:hypothetical protein
MRNTCSKYQLILVPAAAAAAAAFLRHIPQPYSSKLMTFIQQPGVQWVVNLLPLKQGYVCDIFISRVQYQEVNMFFLRISCG